MAASGLVDNLYMTYSGNMLTVVQRMEYYPFGAQFCGYSDSNVQTRIATFGVYI